MNSQEEVQIFCWVWLAGIVIPLIGLLIIKIIENNRDKKMKIRNEKEVPITAAFIIDTMNDEINDYWVPDEKPFNKEIGNCFETRKEAEKAVEKLKALKRLRDRGFRFSHFVMYFEDKCGKVDFRWNTDEKPYSEFEKDLLIIFGGEK